eukprot:TRINITY_DN30445_c0_g1_i1.p1 TRINITY_DN30445_c0_g1~~TRINITY_DN30445_c0_g1_i1.p1  ORF type:complete len:354 (+),score=46.04 TRINITY_DN30445_c0_g1_i1:40-1062(+)
MANLKVDRIFGKEKAVRVLQGRRQISPEVARVCSVDWTTNGMFLLFSTGGGRLLIGSPETGAEQILNIDLGLHNTIKGTNHPGVALMSGSSREGEGQIRCLDLHREEYVSGYMAATLHENVTGLSTAPTHDVFLAAFEGGSIDLHDLRTPVRLCTLVSIDKRKAALFGNIACFSHDGNRIYASCGTDNIAIFDVRNMTDTVGNFQMQHTTAPTTTPSYDTTLQSIDCSPSDDVIAVKLSDNSVYTYNVATGVRQDCARAAGPQEDSIPSPGNCAAWSNSGVLCTGNENGTLTTWVEPRTPIPLSPEIVHSSPVGPVVWNPRFQMLASACYCVFMWTPHGV